MGGTSSLLGAGLVKSAFGERSFKVLLILVFPFDDFEIQSNPAIDAVTLAT
jgi:hypothetical protein